MIPVKTVPAGPHQQGCKHESLSHQRSRLQVCHRLAVAVQAGHSSISACANASHLSNQQNLQQQMQQQQQQHHHTGQLQQQGQYLQQVQQPCAFLPSNHCSAADGAIPTNGGFRGQRSCRLHQLSGFDAATVDGKGSSGGDDTSLVMQPQSPLALDLQHHQHQQDYTRRFRQGTVDGNNSRADSADTDGSSRSQRRRRQQHSKQAAKGSRQYYDGAKPKHQPSSSTEDSGLFASKLLTKTISSQTSWQQLHHLLQQDSQHMNHIHACALLSTTSRCVQYSQLPLHEQQEFGNFFVAALQLAFARVQDSAGPREVSSMLWAVAKVGLHPGPAWLSAYLQAAAHHLQRMNAQDLGLLTWSLARFRHQPEPQWQQQLLDVTRVRMRDLDPQGLCNLLWGLATLDIQPDRSWVAAAVAAASSHMAQFKPQGLAVMLWAVAKLRSRPRQAWLHDAAEAAQRQLEHFKPAELAMVCHALARMRYEQPQQREQQLLWQVQSVSHNRMHSLRFSEAANMLWAFGVRGQQLQPAWLTAALQQLAATMQQADGKALANAVYGLAKMQHRPQQEWWEEVWRQLPLLLPAGADRSVANRIDMQGSFNTAAAAADVSSGDGLCAAAVAAGGTAADCQAQATLMLSLAKLGVAVPPPIATLLLQATQLQLRAHATNSAEVCAVAMAAAKMKLQVPHQWLAAVDGALEALLVQQLSGEQQQPLDANWQHQQCTEVACHQQQQGWPEQAEQQQHYLGVQLKVQPKEVGNTLFSLARLRYVPSDGLLHAVQQYEQQHRQHLTEADQQQLSRALQSMAARRKHVHAQQQEQAGVPAAKMPGDGTSAATDRTAGAGSTKASSRVTPEAGSQPGSSSSRVQHLALSLQHEHSSCFSSSSGEQLDVAHIHGGIGDESWFEVGKYVLHVHCRQGSTILRCASANTAVAADGPVSDRLGQELDAAPHKALTVL